MQHLKKTRKFGRVSKQRSALIRDLIRSLVENEKVVTTEAKAKSLRPVVEKMITRGKNKSLATFKQLASSADKRTAKKIRDILAPRYQSRNGGYTRILKLTPRKSDGSPLSMIEFIK